MKNTHALSDYKIYTFSGTLRDFIIQPNIRVFGLHDRPHHLELHGDNLCLFVNSAFKFIAVVTQTNNSDRFKLKVISISDTKRTLLSLSNDEQILSEISEFIGSYLF